MIRKRREYKPWNNSKIVVAIIEIEVFSLSLLLKIHYYYNIHEYNLLPKDLVIDIEKSQFFQLLIIE